MPITIRIVQTGSSFYFVLISQEEILPGLVNRFRDLCKPKCIKSKIIEKKLVIFSTEGKENEVQQVLQSLNQSSVSYKRLKQSWKKDENIKYLIELHPTTPNQLPTLQQDVDALKSQSPNVIFESFPFIKIIEISSSIPQTILELLKILIEDTQFKKKYSFIIENTELAAAYKNHSNLNASSILMNQFEFDDYVNENPNEYLQISPIVQLTETASLNMIENSFIMARSSLQKCNLPASLSLSRKKEELITYVNKLKTEGSEPITSLILVLQKTHALLEGNISSAEYQNFSREIKSNGSSAMKVLGGLMIALGLIFLSLGGVLALTGVGITAGAATSGLGLATITFGTFFCTRENKLKALSRIMDELDETQRLAQRNTIKTG